VTGWKRGIVASRPAQRCAGRNLRRICAIFDRRILVFDEEAARRYAGLAAKARTAGKRFPVPDGYIAAIATAKGFQVASRDTAPFHAAGVSVINPWELVA
jgi:hypothetical protein